MRLTCSTIFFQGHRRRSVDDRIGHEREPPPRMQPAEVATGKSSPPTTPRNSMIDTHPKKKTENSLNRKATLSRFAQPCSHYYFARRWFVFRFDTQIYTTNVTSLTLHFANEHGYEFHSSIIHSIRSDSQLSIRLCRKHHEQLVIFMNISEAGIPI